ncbi:MAG: Crp/Fnr family transcriptional regulator [Chloroflexota bacterium]
MLSTGSDIARLLNRLPLFADLPAEDIAALAQIARRRDVQRDTILFLEGDPGDTAYILLSGRVDLVLEAFDGNQLLLQQVSAGGHFGEMALLDEKPRSATAIATEDSQAITISRDLFLEHLQERPATTQRLLRIMSERLRAANLKIKMLGFLDVGGRLATTLLDLDRPPGQRATIALRHDELAAMIGSSRQTVSTILGEWRQEGYIITGRGRLTVVDRSALEDLAVT